MSSVFGALALVILFLLLTWLGAPRRAALCGVLVYGGSFFFYWSSITTTQYTLAITVFLLALWRTLAALRTHREEHAILAAGLLGLTLTCHCAFVPAVAVLGAVLAGSRLGTRWRGLGSLAALLIAFFVGLLPYLYLVWVDSTPHPVNYIKYSGEVWARMSGLTAESMQTPWQRMCWLLFGPDAHLTIMRTPRSLARILLDALAIEFLFEYGPFTFGLALLGLWECWKRRTSLAWLLGATLAASLAFSIVMTEGRMLPVFLMPCTLVLGLTAAFGAECIGRHQGRRIASSGWAGKATTVAALALTLVTPHLLRVHANRHPIGRWWRVSPKDGPRVLTVVPQLRHYKAAREYGERVLELAPPNALVIGFWNELMTLFYLHYVEKRRPDLTLEPAALIRLWGWQQVHDVSARPFVLLSRRDSIEPYFLPGADSVRVDDAHHLYIRRTPIRWSPDSLASCGWPVLAPGPPHPVDVPRTRIRPREQASRTGISPPRPCRLG